VAGLAGLLVGLLTGYALRSAPDPATAIEETRTALLGAAATLEIVGVEYAESVEDGRIVARPEYDAALSALSSSRERYAEAAEVVAVVSPVSARAIEDGYGRLERMIRGLADEDDLRAAAESLGDTLAGALRA
jgi:hypothetical protein